MSFSTSGLPQPQLQPQQREPFETDAVPPEEDLETLRRRNERKLQGRFAAIYAKYGRDFDNVSDVVDIASGSVVEDNGHITGMRHERDLGRVPRAGPAESSQPSQSSWQDELTSSPNGRKESLWADGESDSSESDSEPDQFAQGLLNSAAMPSKLDFTDPIFMQNFVQTFSEGIAQQVAKVLQNFQAGQAEVPSKASSGGHLKRSKKYSSVVEKEAATQPHRPKKPRLSTDVPQDRIVAAAVAEVDTTRHSLPAAETRPTAAPSTSSTLVQHLRPASSIAKPTRIVTSSGILVSRSTPAPNPPAADLIRPQWNYREDRILRTFVKTGDTYPPWEEIQKILPHRSERAILERWKNLKRAGELYEQRIPNVMSKGPRVQAPGVEIANVNAPSVQPARLSTASSFVASQKAAIVPLSPVETAPVKQKVHGDQGAGPSEQAKSEKEADSTLVQTDVVLKKRWTDEENALVKRLFDWSKTDWAEVTRLLPQRTRSAVTVQWQRLLKKDANIQPQPQGEGQQRAQSPELGEPGVSGDDDRDEISTGVGSVEILQLPGDDESSAANLRADVALPEQGQQANIDNNGVVTESLVTHESHRAPAEEVVVQDESVGSQRDELRALRLSPSERAVSVGMKRRRSNVANSDESLHLKRNQIPLPETPVILQQPRILPDSQSSDSEKESTVSRKEHPSPSPDTVPSSDQPELAKPRPVQTWIRLQTSSSMSSHASSRRSSVSSTGSRSASAAAVLGKPNHHLSSSARSDRSASVSSRRLSIARSDSPHGEFIAGSSEKRRRVYSSRNSPALSTNGALRLSVARSWSGSAMDSEDELGQP